MMSRVRPSAAGVRLRCIANAHKGLPGIDGRSPYWYQVGANGAIGI
jgi:hypothetical protein